MANQVIEVPPIGVRKRVPVSAINQFIQQVVEKFQPRQIILFGSYAYGHPRSESDVDILVVMDTRLSEAEQAVQILKSVDHRFGIDLLVYTPEKLNQRLEWGDSFLKEITSRGKILYEVVFTGTSNKYSPDP